MSTRGERIGDETRHITVLRDLDTFKMTIRG